LDSGIFYLLKKRKDNFFKTKKGRLSGNGKV